MSGGMTAEITRSMRSSRMSSGELIDSSCWVEIKISVTRTGRRSAYSTVTCVLPSGRRYGRVPSFRTSAKRSARRCARAIGNGNQLRRLVSGISEHETLVTRTDVLHGVLATVDSLGDVRALLVGDDLHVNLVRMKIRIVGVADISNVSRTRPSKSSSAEVRNSPAMTVNPVVRESRKRPENEDRRPAPHRESGRRFDLPPCRDALR